VTSPTPPRPASPLAVLIPPRRHWGGWLLIFFVVIVTCLVPRAGHGPVEWAGKALSERFGDSRAKISIHDIYLALGSIAIIVTAIKRKRRKIFLGAIAAIGTETAIMQITQKALFAGFHLFPRPSGGSGGFPSGHTAVMCVLAYLLTDLWPRAWLLWYGLAGAVAWSRWETNAHYPYQVVAGAVLGLGVALVLTPRFREDEEQSPEPVLAGP
jgi:membrane-associated phospholipid phosphatase